MLGLALLLLMAFVLVIILEAGDPLGLSHQVHQAHQAHQAYQFQDVY